MLSITNTDIDVHVLIVFHALSVYKLQFVRDKALLEFIFIEYSVTAGLSIYTMFHNRCLGLQSQNSLLTLHLLYLNETLQITLLQYFCKKDILPYVSKKKKKKKT